MSKTLSTARGEIKIRESNPTDVVPFRELRLQALQESPTAFGADYQRTLSQGTPYWEDMLARHSDESTIFLAWHEESLVGMTGIARGGSPKTRHSATVWGVYIRPEWRGLHIAEELIRACLQWGRDRKIVAARLGVTTTNASAIRCYERAGFRITGTEPRALYYEGQYHDFYLMYCELESAEFRP
jgi:ribosomal protein S18 acetylase RimI-like enzyme